MTIPGTTWRLATEDTFPKAVEAANRLGAGTTWRFFIHKLANGKWGVWA